MPRFKLESKFGNKSIRFTPQSRFTTHSQDNVNKVNSVLSNYLLQNNVPKPNYNVTYYPNSNIPRVINKDKTEYITLKDRKDLYHGFYIPEKVYVNQDGTIDRIETYKPIRTYDKRTKKGSIQKYEVVLDKKTLFENNKPKNIIKYGSFNKQRINKKSSSITTKDTYIKSTTEVDKGQTINYVAPEKITKNVKKIKKPELRFRDLYKPKRTWNYNLFKSPMKIIKSVDPYIKEIKTEDRIEIKVPQEWTNKDENKIDENVVKEVKEKTKWYDIPSKKINEWYESLRDKEREYVNKVREDNKLTLKESFTMMGYQGLMFSLGLTKSIADFPVDVAKLGKAVIYDAPKQLLLNPLEDTQTKTIEIAKNIPKGLKEAWDFGTQNPAYATGYLTGVVGIPIGITKAGKYGKNLYVRMGSKEIPATDLIQKRALTSGIAKAPKYEVQDVFKKGTEAVHVSPNTGIISELEVLPSGREKFLKKSYKAEEPALFVAPKGYGSTFRLNIGETEYKLGLNPFANLKSNIVVINYDKYKLLPESVKKQATINIRKDGKVALNLQVVEDYLATRAGKGEVVEAFQDIYKTHVEPQGLIPIGSRFEKVEDYTNFLQRIKGQKEYITIKGENIPIYEVNLIKETGKTPKGKILSEADMIELDKYRYNRPRTETITPSPHSYVYDPEYGTYLSSYTGGKSYQDIPYYYETGYDTPIYNIQYPEIYTYNYPNWYTNKYQTNTYTYREPKYTTTRNPEYTTYTTSIPPTIFRYPMPPTTKTTYTKIKSEREKKIKAYIPIPYEDSGAYRILEPFRTYEEAVDEGMEFVDNTTANKFTIQKVSLNQDEVKQRKITQDKRKFVKKGSSFVEKRYNRFDKKGERFGSIIDIFGNRAY